MLLWRFMFFSKRAFNALSNPSRCFGDNSFLLRLVFFIFDSRNLNKDLQLRSDLQLQNRSILTALSCRHQQFLRIVGRAKAIRPAREISLSKSGSRYVLDVSKASFTG